MRRIGWWRDFLTGRVRTNPAARLKPVASQPLAPQGFTAIERQRLRREAERSGPVAHAIVTTLLNTGIRVGELVSLTWSDITLQPRSGHAAIRRGKGARARVVPLNAAVREALRAIQPVPAEGRVFCGKRGPYTVRRVRNLLTVLGRRADVPHVHPHRFRHDTARRLGEAVDLPTVAALLGHSRLDTVRIYAQPMRRRSSVLSLRLNPAERDQQDIVRVCPPSIKCLRHEVRSCDRPMRVHRADAMG
jgi:integrase